MGSVLLGNKDFIHQAIRIRKRWGGGWRQSGYMAAAGLYAIRHQTERLAEDHFHARQIASILLERTEVTNILPVETNIVIFYIDPVWGNSGKWVKKAADNGILCAPFGEDAVRLVTHLNFIEEDLIFFAERLNRI